MNTTTHEHLDPIGTGHASSDARRHALFRRYPLAGEVRLSTGPAPTPYHVYAGHGLFIGGTADLAAVRALGRPCSKAASSSRSRPRCAPTWHCSHESDGFKFVYLSPAGLGA